MPISVLPYAYGGTITFHSFFTYQQKQRQIEYLTLFLSNSLRHSINSKYELYLVREYHKVKNELTGEMEDDDESPHYHFILYSKYYIAISRVKQILTDLQLNWGRSQFYLMSTLKRVNYELYIQKDLQKNLEVFGYEHFKMFEIGPEHGCSKRQVHGVYGEEVFPYWQHALHLYSFDEEEQGGN